MSGGFDFERLVELCRRTHEETRRSAARAIDRSLVVRNWLFGWYIVEYEQSGADRAEYGVRLLDRMSDRLRETGIRGTSTTRLKLYRQFYRQRGSIGPTLSDQSLLPALPEGIGRIRPTPSDQFHNSWSASLPQIVDRLQGELPLGWSHYVTLLSVTDPEARRFYEILIKDPVVLEFLGLEETPAYSETDLETAIIDRLQQFLLELGKGFLFEARQKRFSFDDSHFFVDLVFYNRLLRCYVLIDLKTGKLTHQDLGQMQMYVNYFDRYVKIDGELPTVGILLCDDKNDAVVELTLPEDANIYASKYQLYLPSREELADQVARVRREIGGRDSHDA